MSSKSIAEILEPNEEDENGPYWDPWSALGIYCATYNSRIDADALAVLVGIHKGLFNEEIAAAHVLPEQYVELLQSIFSSAGWCDYGTSPRGCFPSDPVSFPKIIDTWREYYRRTWGEN